MSKLQRKPAGLRLAPINLKASTSATTSASASSQATLSLKPSHSFDSTSSWREDIARITLSNAPASSPNGSDPNSAQASFIRQYGELKPEEFDNIKKLGEGASGTVMKVLHKPSNLIMAKKVCARYLHAEIIGNHNCSWNLTRFFVSIVDYNRPGPGCPKTNIEGIVFPQNL